MASRMLPRGVDGVMTTTTPWLFVLSGRPGTGKSTLAKALVQRTRAVYLRVDAVEAALAGVGAQWEQTDTW